jgi:peptidoglycan-N-acetylglucosamine deacetylase
MLSKTNKLRTALGGVAQRATGALTRVITEKPIASLTFDDGPDPFYTPQVLKLLHEYDARATFFMVGEGAHRYPDIVKQVASAGHAIGNHSWSHYAFPLISAAKRWSEIRQCHRVLKPYGLRLFRPPYGMNNNRSNIGAFLQGYKVIGWSVQSHDWRETNSTFMMDNIVKSIKPGSIILFHDRIFDRGKPTIGPKPTEEAAIDRESMLSALTGVLERLKGTTQFVTVPVLLRNGRPMREYFF